MAVLLAALSPTLPASDAAAQSKPAKPAAASDAKKPANKGNAAAKAGAANAAAGEEAPTTPRDPDAPEPPIDGGRASGQTRSSVPAMRVIELKWPNLEDMTRRICGDGAESGAVKGALSCAGDGYQAWFRIQEGSSYRSFPPRTSMTTACDAATKVAKLVDFEAPGAAPTKELLKACGAQEDPARLVAQLCKTLPDKSPMHTALECGDSAGWTSQATSRASSWEAKTVGMPSQKQTLCDVVLKTPGADGLRTIPAYDELHELCKPGTKRAGAGIALAAFVAPMLQGAGDFLKERAQEELLAFAVESIGEKFCGAGEDYGFEDLQTFAKHKLTIKYEKDKTGKLADVEGFALGTSKPIAWLDSTKLTGLRWSDPILAARSAATLPNGVAVGYWALGSVDNKKARELRTNAMSNRDLASGSMFFPETCATFLPRGLRGHADVDAIYSGRLQRVLAGEVMTLPIRLLSLEGLPLSKATATATEEKQLRIMAYTLATQLLSTVQTKKPALEFLEGLEPAIRKALESESIDKDKTALPTDCKFQKGTTPSLPCVLGLFFTMASKTQVMLEQLDAEKFPPEQLGFKWIEEGTKSFCKEYGGETGGNTCVFGGLAETEVAVWNELQAMVQAIADFHDAVSAVEVQYKAALASKPPMVAGAEAAEGVAAALDALTGSMLSLGEAIAKHVATTQGSSNGLGNGLNKLQQLKQVTGLVHEGLKATTAATRQDYRAVATSLNVMLNSPLVAPYIHEKTKKGLTFVFALGQAKTRDDVHKLLDEHAAPLGSYRAKYVGTNRWFINGFVGLGGSYNFWTMRTREKNDVVQRPDDFSFVPLSAPIGIDWTIASRKTQNVGLTLTVLDPLALRVVEREDQEVEYDFDGVVSPGLFVRWGMFRSPIALMGGVRWQPLMKSGANDCGAGGKQACWQGPMQVMLNVAVDLPIYPLD
ncbi:hypothetical protein [Polyangium fumosum]|uniref:Uncharacterized protein n=1 Tax=Polyangium fumosum TaxID=889272 RepID=A0A4U1J929_9BACT|nr:hypothetical protein [Polyangium fumosum]TKD04498.1 hypothetical protein E8A74_23090 [Polyangium fumosum]